MNCDLPYWFDVLVTANATKYLAVGADFSVACTDNTIFITIASDEVLLAILAFYIRLEVDLKSSSMNSFGALRDEQHRLHDIFLT